MRYVEKFTVTVRGHVDWQPTRKTPPSHNRRVTDNVVAFTPDRYHVPAAGHPSPARARKSQREVSSPSSCASFVSRRTPVEERMQFISTREPHPRSPPRGHTPWTCSRRTYVPAFFPHIPMERLVGATSYPSCLRDPRAFLFGDERKRPAEICVGTFDFPVTVALATTRRIRPRALLGPTLRQGFRARFLASAMERSCTRVTGH